ncbi:hypothetical protein FOA52_011255 [Chlamydomonas sp. UWO 241]|nr:hypothetical protein FOA52_011255 [Chlamydomonas sp. UWO 241]
MPVLEQRLLHSPRRTRAHAPCTAVMRPAQIHFMMLMSRQGKVRLAKWYMTYSQKERARAAKEITPLILARPLKLCNFLDWKNIKLVYRRYASLYFICGVDMTDNELITLEIIHEFVEVLDRYFGNVCELDLIFNFHKAYYILDELLIAGELQEPSKRVIAKAIEAQDGFVENAKKGLDENGAPLGLQQQIHAMMRNGRISPGSSAMPRLWARTHARTQDNTKNFNTQRLVCVNGCNGKGNCTSGVCHCQPGHFGADCSLSMGRDARMRLLADYGYTPRATRPRVYVYELPSNMSTWHNTRRVDRPLHVVFWQRLLSSGARTADPAEADWFFIPLRVRSGRDAFFLIDAIDYIRRTWPYYNASVGADHFAFHLADSGSADIPRDARDALRNLTWLHHWGLHEDHDTGGWRAEHVPGKDVVVPILVPPHHYGTLGISESPLHPDYSAPSASSSRQKQRQRPQELLSASAPSVPGPDGHPGSDRSDTLLYFGGRVCGDESEPNTSWPACLGRGYGFSGLVRQRVFHHHFNRSGFVVTSSLDRSASHMRASRFCLAPPGSAYGHRQVLVTLMGCVPVVIGDHIYQPFDPELDWLRFSLEPSEAQIPVLHEVLAGVDGRALAALQANLACAAQHLSYSSVAGGFMGESGKYDAFETILQILRVKKQYPHAAPFEYTELDADFGRFVRCGAKEEPWADAVAGPVLSAAGGASLGGKSDGGGGGVFSLFSGRGGKEGVPGARGSAGAGETQASGGGGGGRGGGGEQQLKVCSRSEFDPEERSCGACPVGKGMTSAYAVPGGMVCCGRPNLASCLRFWE